MRSFDIIESFCTIIHYKFLYKPLIQIYLAENEAVEDNFAIVAALSLNSSIIEALIGNFSGRNLGYNITEINSCSKDLSTHGCLSHSFDVLFEVDQNLRELQLKLGNSLEPLVAKTQESIKEPFKEFSQYWKVYV